MRTLLILIAVFLASHFSLFSQPSLTINYHTLGVTVQGHENFKVGDFINVKIEKYDPKKDDQFSIEITGEQYENSSGINAFKKLTSTEVTTEGVRNEETNYVLPLQIPDKDISVIKIKRYSNDGKIQLEERSYFFRNKGGLKFDVSSGFFISNLRDESYALKSINADNKEIVREKNGDIRAGIGLLAHLHRRSQSWANLGLTGGFEINNDAKVGFLAGASLFCGYDRKFVFSFGFAFSKVKAISSLYNVGDIVSSSVNDVPTVANWKQGYFASLTYNF